MKVLVSACLLGQKVRYDGGHNFVDHPWIKALGDLGLLVPVCPEVAGGLGTPRIAAERHQSGSVLTKDGQDVTDAFLKGAACALKIVQDQGIKIAILKARSPSCGNKEIYDGSFSGKRIQGSGVTAEALYKAGISVFSEEEIEEARETYERLSNPPCEGLKNN